MELGNNYSDWLTQSIKINMLYVHLYVGIGYLVNDHQVIKSMQPQR